MKPVCLLIGWAWFVSLAAPSLAQTAPPSRGALLYDTHCIACHSTQVHWRDNKAATDWASLRSEVRRWQASAQLRWSDEDIDEVARLLNERYYRFERPAARGGLGAASPRARPTS